MYNIYQKDIGCHIYYVCNKEEGGFFCLSNLYDLKESESIEKLIHQIINNKKYAILNSKHKAYFIRKLCKLVLQKETITIEI